MISIFDISAMDGLAVLLPKVFSFLDTPEDFRSASQVSRSWQTAAHHAAPHRLTFDCESDDDSSDGDGSTFSTRSVALLRWFRDKINRGEMTELRSVTFEACNSGTDDMAAWCLLLEQLVISHLQISALAIGSYHQFLPRSITHLEVDVDHCPVINARKLKQLHHLNTLRVSHPFSLDTPLQVQKLELGDTLSYDGDLQILLPVLREIKMRLFASLSEQVRGDVVLDLPSLTRAHFNIISMRGEIAQGCMKFQAPPVLNFTVSKPSGLRVLLCETMRPCRELYF